MPELVLISKDEHLAEIKQKSRQRLVWKHSGEITCLLASHLINPIVAQSLPPGVFVRHLLYLENPTYLASSVWDLAIVALVGAKLRDASGLGLSVLLRYYALTAVGRVIPQDRRGSTVSSLVNLFARLALVLQSDWLGKDAIELFVWARAASLAVLLFWLPFARWEMPSSDELPFPWIDGINLHVLLIEWLAVRYFMPTGEQLAWSSFVYYSKHMHY